MADISIIVPTLNRDAVLGETLEAIARAAHPADPVEVIVVDNGSADRTAAVFQAAAERHPKLDWRYFHDAVPGLLTGRHRGAAEARGEILAYLDDDSLVEPTWLEAVQEAFRDPDVALAGGPSRPRFDATPPAWLSGLWWEREEGRSCGALSLSDLGGDVKPVDPCLVWGLNFSIRKSVFLACGGFHPDTVPRSLQRFQGDGETGLSLKIKRRNLVALYHPHAAVTHVIPASRLTVRAIEQRGFYQGVCDSFTAIRAAGATPSASKGSWKDALRPLKRNLHRLALRASSDVSAIREMTARAHWEGREFHGSEVRNDPALLDWVLRPTYMDRPLPAGWEGFMSPPLSRPERNSNR